MSANSEYQIDGRATARHDDAVLMQRLRRRDQGALAEIMNAHWQSLLAYVTGLMRDRAAAEDIAQQALLRLWERNRGWLPNASIRTFLYRVARNLALNEQEARRVRHRLGPELELLSSSPSTPLENLEQEELRSVVNAAVQQLPERRREIFILARLHDLSYKEIAEITGISPQTVANQMSSALTDLRRLLAHFIERPEREG